MIRVESVQAVYNQAGFEEALGPICFFSPRGAGDKKSLFGFDTSVDRSLRSGQEWYGFPIFILSMFHTTTCPRLL